MITKEELLYAIHIQNKDIVTIAESELEEVHRIEGEEVLSHINLDALGGAFYAVIYELDDCFLAIACSPKERLELFNDDKEQTKSFARRYLYQLIENAIVRDKYL